MVSTNPGSGNFPSNIKKDRETMEVSNGRDEGSRPFIPGLPADRLANKRIHKKRRKRKNVSNDGQSGEQSSCPTQSSIISQDGHSSMPSLITTQQHQKGKCINTIHRGSSSSEDLFTEGNIIRSDNPLIKMSATNPNKI